MQTIIGKDFPKVVIPLFDNAKSDIKLVVFDWRWYPNDPGSPTQLFNQALVSAIKRGVTVSAVVNSKAIKDVLEQVGVKVTVANTKTIMHAKFIIIDNKLVVVGSHNYTQNAFTMNYELSVLLDDLVNADEFNNFFNVLCQL